MGEDDEEKDELHQDPLTQANADNDQIKSFETLENELNEKDKKEKWPKEA